MGEVLGWFDRCGLQFVRGIPAVSVVRDGEPNRSDLFAPMPRGTALDHFWVQLKQVFTGSREGGFFIMIGRKPEEKGSDESQNEKGDLRAGRQEEHEIDRIG